MTGTCLCTEFSGDNALCPVHEGRCPKCERLGEDHDGVACPTAAGSLILPWQKFPDAWWAVDSTDGWTDVLPSAAMTASDPTGWTRVNAPTPFHGPSVSDMAIGHEFKPGHFSPDQCQVMLARSRCPYTREDHAAGEPS